MAERDPMDDAVYNNKLWGDKVTILEERYDDLKALVEKLRAALVLCNDALQILKNRRDDCGSYDTECVLQDLGSNSCSFTAAQKAAQAALAKSAEGEKNGLQGALAQALADIAARTERETAERCKTIIKERAEQWKRAGKPPDGHTDETVMRRRAMTDAANELYADILALAPAPGEKENKS